MGGPLREWAGGPSPRDSPGKADTEYIWEFLHSGWVQAPLEQGREGNTQV